jgi:hypothetical protein
MAAERSQRLLLDAVVLLQLSLPDKKATQPQRIGIPVDEDATLIHQTLHKLPLQMITCDPFVIDQPITINPSRPPSLADHSRDGIVCHHSVCSILGE